MAGTAIKSRRVRRSRATGPRAAGPQAIPQAHVLVNPKTGPRQKQVRPFSVLGYVEIMYVRPFKNHNMLTYLIMYF